MSVDQSDSSLLSWSGRVRGLMKASVRMQSASRQSGSRDKKVLAGRWLRPSGDSRQHLAGWWPKPFHLWRIRTRPCSSPLTYLTIATHLCLLRLPYHCVTTQKSLFTFKNLLFKQLNSIYRYARLDF